MSVKQNNSRFSPGAHDPNCGFLGQVTVAGMCPILWIGKYNPQPNKYNQESAKLLPERQSHSSPWAYLARFTAELEYWIQPTLLIPNSLHGIFHYCGSQLLEMKLLGQYSSIAPCLLTQICGIFKNRILPLENNQEQWQQPVMFWESLWDSTDQQDLVLLNPFLKML